MQRENGNYIYFFLFLLLNRLLCGGWQGFKLFSFLFISKFSGLVDSRLYNE